MDTPEDFWRDAAADAEPMCSKCADMGCGKCDPGYASTYPLAAAIDCIVSGKPFEQCLHPEDPNG